MELWLGFIITGLFAGFISGLLGIGGGVVIVPALAFIFARHAVPASSVMHAATATSLAIMVFTTTASAISHHRHEPIRWPLYWKFFPGLVLGACTGVVVAHFLHPDVLRITFAIFLFFVSAKLFLHLSAKPDVTLPGTVDANSVSFAIGSIASMLGIGGSVFMTPYLLHHHISVRRAVGVAVVASFTIALIGASVSIFTGSTVPDLPGASSGYIVWTAVLGVALPSLVTVPLGAWVSHHTDIKLLQHLFAVLLLAISAHLIWMVWL